MEKVCRSVADSKREIELICSQSEAVNIFCRKNPNKKPIIVFDSGNFSFYDALCTSKGRYYSGELNEFDRTLDHWLENLKRRAQLIVFGEFCVEKHTTDEWINRRNEEFRETEFFYEWIDKGERASNHGKLKLGRIGHDIEPEIAHYATTKGAMAIFTRDTNFMIFDGLWKFWSYVDIDFEQFKVKEFDRLFINQVLSLTFEQRPLLATLMGNSFTEKYKYELHKFHRELGKHTFHNVAQYIRQIFNERNLTLDDIDEIAMVVAKKCFRQK